MHKDALHISVETARRLIWTQFPQFAGLSIEQLKTSGTDHSIFRIGSVAAAKFPLRLNKSTTDSDKLDRELAAMTELARFSPVPTPLPIGVGLPCPNYPGSWMAQTWVEGVVATPEGLCRSTSFTLDLANLVITLRRADVQGRTFDGKGRGGSLADHDGWMETCFARSEGLLDVPKLRQLWARLRELSAPSSLVMSHKDLIPANLLVCGEQLVGLLDGGGFGPADPALDLVAGWHLLDGDCRDVFRSRIGCHDIEWKRGAAWAFQQAMGLVWYYDQTNPTMSALGRSTVARIVAESRL